MSLVLLIGLILLAVTAAGALILGLGGTRRWVFRRGGYLHRSNEAAVGTYDARDEAAFAVDAMLILALAFVLLRWTVLLWQ